MRILSLLLILLFSYNLHAQEKIKGMVIDQNSQAVFAANVYWKNHPQLGVVSNFNGEFEILLPKDSKPESLIVSFIGYKNKMLSWEEIKKQKPLLIKLESDSQQLESITVIGKDPISEKFSVLKMEKLDVYLNPVASGDPLKAITFLPSSTNTDEMANPAIRGSSPDKSRVILNGVPVIKPVRNSQINGMGNFSLFNTEIIHKQYVYASNPPLSYGNTSAGIIEIETVRNIDQSMVQISTSLANTGLFISQKQNKKCLLQAYGNWQFSRPFLHINKKSLEKLNDFSSKDAGLNMKFEINKRLTLNTFNYFINEDYDVNSYEFAYRGKSFADNKRLISINNLHYKTKNGLFSTNLGWDASRNSYRFGNLFSKGKNQNFYVSVNYKWIVNSKTRVQTGIKEAYKKYQFRDSVPEYYYSLFPQSENNYQHTSTNQHNVEAYAFGSYNVSKKFMLSSGVRANIPANNQKSYVSGQLSLKYSWANAHSLLLSLGKYHNYSTPNYYQPEFALNRSYQVALDYDFNLKKSKYHAALYYKKDRGNWRTANYFDFSNSKVWGVELSWEQLAGRNWQISCSNTILKQDVFSEDKWYKGTQDLDYFVKASLSYNHPKWINSSVVFMARPGLNYTAVKDALFVEEANAWQPVYAEKIHASHYTKYQTLNFTASKILPMGKHSAILFFSITNLFDRKNQKNLEYNADYTIPNNDYYGHRIYYFGTVFQLSE